MKFKQRYAGLGRAASTAPESLADERPATRLEYERIAPETSELWRFVVDCGTSAEHVYLVKDCDGQASVWIEMDRDDEGQWIATDRLTPGRYRVRCISREGDSYYNCGTAGLSCNRLTDQVPGVLLETWPM